MTAAARRVHRGRLDVGQRPQYMRLEEVWRASLVNNTGTDVLEETTHSSSWPGPPGRSLRPSFVLNANSAYAHRGRQQAHHAVPPQIRTEDDAV